MQEVVLIHENLRQSFAKDFMSFLLAISLLGVGWGTGSSAAEWIGFVLFWLAILRWGAFVVKKSPRYTPQSLADYLLKEYGVVGKKEE
jgi:acyl-CoA synthetase (AMP-forming)/AMP-acid ligase II